MEEEEEEKDQAQPNSSASWWSSWGQEWIDSVKEKSASTLEMVKKDLNEFVDVIQGDTSVAISETATKIEDTVKKEGSPDETEDSTKKVLKQGVEGLSKFLHSVSELMAIEPDDTQEEFITLTDDKFSVLGYDRKQEKLHTIQTDPGTYCNEPEGLFVDWLQVFNMDDHKTEMSDLLVQNTAVRAIYTQLVPNVVSHTTFWQRYFYQIFLLEAEEHRRAELLARANDTSSKDEMDGGWGDDDDDDGDIEVVKSSSSAVTVIHIENDLTTSEMNDSKHSMVHANSGSSEDIKCKDETTILTNPSEIINNAPDSLSMSAVRNEIPIATPEVQCVTDNIQKMSENLSEVNISKETLGTELSTNTCDTIDVTLDKSCDTLRTSKEFDKELITNQTSPSSSPETKTKSASNSRLQLLQDPDIKNEYSETSSLSSWISIDDDMKVKRIKGGQEMKADSNENSEGKSSRGSSGVMVNKSDADGLDDDDDFDLELDEDVNEEELAKMVEDIKNKSAAGTLQDDDDDWENWE